MKNIFRNIIPAIAAAVILCGCDSDSFPQPDYYSNEAATKIGKSIAETAGSYIGHIKNDVQTKISTGVNLFEMSFLNRDGYAMQMYLYTVSLGQPSVTVTKPEGALALQKLSEQAMALENQGRYMVLGAISAGKSSNSADCLFAKLNDGTAVCIPASSADSYKGRIKESVGGEAMLLEDGYELTQNDIAGNARAAVGVSENGNEVYMLVVDGGDFYYSNGIGCADLALLMKACGASDAILLNSGSNSTFLWRNERSAELLEVMNKPSDKGKEAEVASGLAIVQ